MTKINFRFVVTHAIHGVLFTLPLKDTYERWEYMRAWLQAAEAANAVSHNKTLFTCSVYTGLTGTVVNNTTQVHNIMKNKEDLE